MTQIFQIYKKKNKNLKNIYIHKGNWVNPLKPSCKHRSTLKTVYLQRFLTLVHDPNLGRRGFYDGL